MCEVWQAVGSTNSPQAEEGVLRNSATYEKLLLFSNVAYDHIAYN